MRLEATPAPRRSATAGWNLHEIAAKLAVEIAHLDSGSAAALRRGPLEGAGAAAFWKLTAELVPDLTAHREAGWATMVHAIAILTPKGRDMSKKSAYDPSLAVGRALYNAGVSELRLARLLASPPDMRQKLTIRLCRWLAGSEQNRLDLVTLAQFILFGEAAGRRIAREYYRAEATDRRRKSQDKEASTNA